MSRDDIKIIQSGIESLKLDLNKLSFYRDDICLTSGKHSIALRPTVKDTVIEAIRRDLEWRIMQLISLIAGSEQ
jgi:hypothetical protein